MALLAFNDWRPVAHVCGSLIGKAAEDEQQELVVVPLVGKIPDAHNNRCETNEATLSSFNMIHF